MVVYILIAARDGLEGRQGILENDKISDVAEW